MKAGLKFLFPRRYAVGIVLLVISACDVFIEDGLKPENQVVTGQTEYYTLPGKAVVIDLKSVFTASYINAEVKVSENPGKGTLTELEPLLLRYQPFTTFKEGADYLVVSVVSNGQVVKTEKVSITLKVTTDDFPCSLYAVEDIGYKTESPTVTVSFLDNDRICGVNRFDLAVSIHIAPKKGEAMLSEQATIVYTPGPDFNSRDELVYKVTSSDGKLTSYGKVSIIEPQSVIDSAAPTPPTVTLLNGWRYQVLSLPPSYKYYNTMFFVDEDTGFVGRGSALHKTRDGGLSWNEVYNGFIGPVSAIFFLDPLNGFVSQYRDLLKTTDGGATWNKVHLDNVQVNSIYFSSASSGVLAGNTSEGYWDQDYETKMLKTSDGGATWKEVLVLPFHDFVYQQPMVFSNPNTGLVNQFEWYPLGPPLDPGYLTSKLFRTMDKGESWELVYSGDDWRRYTISKDNVIYAVKDLTYPTGNQQCSVAKTQDGLNWHSLVDFQHSVVSIGFSPSGQLLFTAGVNGNWYNASAYTLSTSMSVDGGETWFTVDTGLTVGEGDFYGAAPMPSIAIPSDNVVYVEYGNRLVKYWKP